MKRLTGPGWVAALLLDGGPDTGTIVITIPS